eukprot:3779713-Amphidinium_carterae.1
MQREVALPVASVHVLNRAKDPVTKRHKYPQVINDFSEALAHGGGPCGVSGATAYYSGWNMLTPTLKHDMFWSSTDVLEDAWLANHDP